MFSPVPSILYSLSFVIFISTLTDVVAYFVIALLFFTETNGQEAGSKPGTDTENDLTGSIDAIKVGERGGGSGTGISASAESGSGVSASASRGTVTGGNVGAGVGVKIDGIQEEEWDEDKWSVSESEYKKYVKDSDIEDYLRGE